MEETPGVWDDTGPRSHGIRVCLDGLTFSSQFEGGNLAAVRRADGENQTVASGIREYCLWAAPDCAGTDHEEPFCLWYNFAISGGEPGRRVRLRIVNLHRVARLYHQDLTPVFRVLPRSPRWDRLPGDTTRFRIARSELIGAGHAQCIELSFDFTFGGSGDQACFAFFYPYPLQQCQRLVRCIGARFGCGAAVPEDEVEKRGDEAVEGVADGIYFHRELLTRSLDSHRVEVLTVSASSNLRASGERETKLQPAPPSSSAATITACKTTSHAPAPAPPASTACASCPSDPGGASGLSRECGRPTSATAAPRARQFIPRPSVFISARVHPGETASSYLFEALLQALLDPCDPRAAALRQRFVFKFVPMLNPDGVVRGHHRCDSRGVNLNREYAAPQPELHPTIYWARAVLGSMAAAASDSYQAACPNLVGASGDASSFAPSADGGLWLYLDCHAYASSSGAYLMSNGLGPAALVEHLCFARLVSLYSPSFNFDGCSFGGRGKRKKRRGSKKNSSQGDGEDGSNLCMLALPERRCTRMSDAERREYTRGWSKFKAEIVGGEETKKSGAGRVVACVDFGVVHSYTCECSCNAAPVSLELASHSTALQVQQTDEQRLQVPPAAAAPAKQSPENFANVGRGIMFAILDLSSNAACFEDNPRAQSTMSLLPHSEYHSVEGLRSWAREQVLQREQKSGSATSGACKATKSSANARKNTAKLFKPKVLVGSAAKPAARVASDGGGSAVHMFSLAKKGGILRDGGARRRSRSGKSAGSSKLRAQAQARTQSSDGNDHIVCSVRSRLAAARRHSSSASAPAGQSAARPSVDEVKKALLRQMGVPRRPMLRSPSPARSPGFRRRGRQLRKLKQPSFVPATAASAAPAPASTEPRTAVDRSTALHGRLPTLGTGLTL